MFMLSGYLTWSFQFPAEFWRAGWSKVMDDVMCQARANRPVGLSVIHSHKANNIEDIFTFVETFHGALTRVSTGDQRSTLGMLCLYRFQNQKYYIYIYMKYMYGGQIRQKSMSPIALI